MLPQHTIITPNGVYRYRRRTPHELKIYIGVNEIIRSLGKSQSDAIKRATELTQIIYEAIQLTQLSSVPSSVIQSLLADHSLLSCNEEKVRDATNGHTWSQVVRIYLKQSKVTPMELANRTYFFTTLTPSIFQVLFKTDDPSLTKFTYDAQLNIRTLLLKLPKRNIHKYRCIDLKDLVSGIHNGKITVAQEDSLALDTINKSLKRLKSLLLFARNSGMYNGIIPNMTIENRMQARGQRKEFSNDELRIIDNVLQCDAIYPIVKILKYSGMRFSELLKCSVSEIEGILCFDLRTPTEPLKTLSSHRIIPVHPDLKGSVNGFQELISSHFDKHFAKKFTKVIKKHLLDTQGKSLYSLRHSFATQLIANGTPAEVVSELMGHSHSSMTLNRYVKGYPITILKAAIDSL